MLPQLVTNAGIAAIAAGATVMALSARGPIERDYTITITKNAGTYSVEPKYFQLAFRGTTNWDVINKTGDRITFDMTDFDRDGPRQCPLHFIKGGSTQVCVGSVLLEAADGYTKPIKVARGDAETPKRYKFAYKIGGATIDPEIELERDTFRMIQYLLLILGGAATVVGWWLGRRANAASQRSGGRP